MLKMFVRKSANKREEKFFNYFKRNTKQTSQRYLDAAIESNIGELYRFLSKSPKKYLSKSSFGNVIGYDCSFAIFQEFCLYIQFSKLWNDYFRG